MTNPKLLAWVLIAFILLALICLFSSCSEIHPASRYTIEAGDHYSKPIGTVRTGDVLMFNFYADSEWIYPEQPGQGWNKLIGIGHIDHHNNSARLAWRPHGEDSIMFAGYFYRAGEREIKPLGAVQAGAWYSGGVSYFDGEYFVSCDGEFVVLSGVEHSGHWLLKPYFGGSSPAPWRMRFEFEW